MHPPEWHDPCAYLTILPAEQRRTGTLAWSLKQECIRPKTPLNLEDARQLVAGYVLQYNNERLHSAIGYITPRNKLDDREAEIISARQRKLQQARQRRQTAKKTSFPPTTANPIPAVARV
ncbi:MAG: hypothetical protein D6681_22915 [Calditrichaeota bacterium]|nr:MAG: hypothetical protein D6681_22915 [Calditrichota bacterium]